MLRASAAVVIALGLTGAARDCGGGEEPAGGPNAPCTRSRDCTSGLACAEGVCVDPTADAAAPAPKDASDDGG